MVKCSVYRCDSDSSNKNPGLTFHRFPKDEKLKKAWIVNMQIKPTPSGVLCSKHFEQHLLDPSVFRTRLRPGSIPTLLNGLPPVPHDKGNVINVPETLPRTQPTAGTIVSGPKRIQIKSVPAVSNVITIINEENSPGPSNYFSMVPSIPAIPAVIPQSQEVVPVSYKYEVQRLRSKLMMKNKKVKLLQQQCRRFRKKNEKSMRGKQKVQNDIKVFCPKCNSKVSHTAEGMQLDQTKIIVAKVYHYFEQEYEELKKTVEGIDQTPLSKFRQRTALATGVSETTVEEILQEEARRNEDMRQQTLQQQSLARKRPRQTDSSFEDGSSDENIADDDDETQTLVIKEAPVESYNEEPEIFVELSNVKQEPDVFGDNQELTDPIAIEVKTEPRDEEATTSNETTAVQRDTKGFKKMKTERNTDGPPAAYAPPAASAPPATATPAAPPATSAPLERQMMLLEDDEIKMEKIEIGEEGFS